jgi:hypothetical protein
VNAQEVVHALAGTVSSIDAAAKTLTVKTDDGSEGLFKAETDSKTPLEFNKDVRAETTPAAKFTRTGAEVVVYYFGGGFLERTAAAVQDLGAGPFIKTSGTVSKFDKHHHMVTIKDSLGTEHPFKIDSKTIAETSVGAVEGFKFDPQEGDQVRITGVGSGGDITALFIRAK